MDEKTLTALNASITKWERRASGDHNEHLGMISCPLCKVFHGEYRGEGKSCQGCPVFESTGSRYCEDTPYTKYYRKRTTANAQAELDFLKSLLPKKEVFKWVDLDSLSNVEKS